jgi:hypothetical protein
MGTSQSVRTLRPVEEAIRTEIAGLKSGDVITAEQLARRLDLDETQVCIWLDLLVDEGRLIPEHHIVSEVEGAKPVIRYRVPLYR